MTDKKKKGGKGSRPDLTTEGLKNEYGLTYEEYTKPKWERIRKLWTQELEDEIISRVSNGEPITHITKEDHMPAYPTFYRWVYGEYGLIPKPEADRLRERYARAQLDYHIRLANEVTSIADDDSGDHTLKKTIGGKEVVIPNKEYTARSKLRIEARQWILSKFAPKQFGDKVQVEHTGQVEHTQAAPAIDMDKLTPLARGKLIAFLEQVEADKEQGLVTLDLDAEDAEWEEVE